jgi:hypothetical protein
MVVIPQSIPFHDENRNQTLSRDREKIMAPKNNRAELSNERALSVVAAMKFWSRFKQPHPSMAFAFAEPSESMSQSLGVLHRLPSVSIDNTVAYSLRISLNGAKPTVWRRVLVKGTSLEVLHHIIQMVMCWDDSHLHGFEVRKTRVPLVEDGASIDERAITIAQLHAARIKKFHYTYDFGDDWRHTVLIEDVTTLVPGLNYPQCIDGKGTAPVEDVGGIDNWSMLLDAIRNPKKERDEEVDALLERVGKDFSPPAFDLAKTNAKLQRAFAKSGNKGHA